MKKPEVYFRLLYKVIIPGIVVLFIPVAIIVFLFTSVFSEKSTPNESSYISSPSVKDYVDLKATVIFNGTQFIISNNDNFNYNDIKMKVNGKFILKVQNLKAGEVYTVGLMQFADDDGNRFTLLQKPQEFLISCKTGGGQDGFYSAVDTPDKISSLRRSKLTTFCRPKWSVHAGAN